jgi:hypothetical protein
MWTGGRPQQDVLTMERKHELRASNDERRPDDNRQLRPWRTEGLPQEQPPNRRRRWMIWAVWLLGLCHILRDLDRAGPDGGPGVHSLHRVQSSGSQAERF